MGLAVDLDPPRVGVEPPSGSRRGVSDDDVVDADEATGLTRLEKICRRSSEWRVRPRGLPRWGPTSRSGVGTCRARGPAGRDVRAWGP